MHEYTEFMVGSSTFLFVAHTDLVADKMYTKACSWYNALWVNTRP